MIRRTWHSEARPIRNILKTNQKNSEGSIPGSFPPPVAPRETFSPRRRAREKRVISKALTEWAGYRPRRLRPISLSLRPFSPQAGNCANLVPSLAFQENQAIRGRRNPAEFKSATGCRKVPQTFYLAFRSLRGFHSSALLLDSRFAHTDRLANDKMAYIATMATNARNRRLEPAYSSMPRSTTCAATRFAGEPLPVQGPGQSGARDRRRLSRPPQSPASTRTLVGRRQAPLPTTSLALGGFHGEATPHVCGHADRTSLAAQPSWLPQIALTSNPYEA